MHKGNVDCGTHYVAKMYSHRDMGMRFYLAVGKEFGSQG